jgi:hypothetical protein
MTTNEQTHFSGLLGQIADELDIPPSKREDVENKYKAVTSWLADPDASLAPYSPDIYPHGSFRLGTVVRPLERDEFDLDFVSCLDISANPHNQADVKQKVGDRLKENGTYRTNRMIWEKNRCWQVRYAGDFHMDIMPAVPDIRGVAAGAILVSDRDLAKWMPSNPRGFAVWFDNQLVPFRQAFRALKQATVEELPDPKIKTPLQMAIQILKRHRDMRFKSEPKLRPSSIVLTTLAAKAYGQQQDLVETLYAVVRGMPGEIEYDGTGIPVVRNPTNPEENFAEKWQEYPERFNAFRTWLLQLTQDMDKLLTLKGARVGEFLKDLLGDREVSSVFRSRATAISQAHQQGRLNAGIGGGLTIVSKPSQASRPVQRSTSYGERP